MKASYFTITVKDREGKLLKCIRRKSYSYLKQWNELVCAQAKYDEAVSIKNTDGVNKSVAFYNVSLGMTADAADVRWGNVVGRGSTAVAIDDYKLETLCTEGTGENQLSYLACTVGASSVVASSASFEISRSALNLSGAAITVTEIGIIARGYDAGIHSFQVIRDVLASSVEVPDGGAISVVYTLKVTV